MATTLECTLDTVIEENEYDPRHSIIFQNTLFEDCASHDDEVFTILIEMLVSFLSSKSNEKIDNDKTLGVTTYEELRDIIHYVGVVLGFEEALGSWHASTKLNLKLLR